MTKRRDDGFDDLFRREFPSVMRSARLIVGDAELARDIAQDAFTKLFVHWTRVSAYEAPGAWVRRVALNGAMNAAAKARTRSSAEMSLTERITETSASGLDEDLAAALADLSPQQRAAVALFYLEDRPVADIAQLMGTTESTVKAHLQRGRQRLANALHPEVPDALT